MSINPQQLDANGVTWEQFSTELFEYEYCHECYGDAEDHEACIGPFGLWFAKCKYDVVLRTPMADPFQHATPCWIQGYGNMHTAQCIELNDRNAREICACTRKPLMRTPVEREAYVLVQMLARGEVSL